MIKRFDRMTLRSVVAATVFVAATALTVAAELETTVCTVRTVDPASREVTAISGRGYALRVRVFHVDPACRIALAGGRADLLGVKPGQVVEVRHKNVGGRDVAVSIASVPHDDKAVRP